MTSVSKGLSLGLAALVAAALLPRAAAAHATMLETDPTMQARLERPPDRIVLRFDQAVNVLEGAIEVRTADGRLVSAPARSEADGRLIEARIRTALARGAYTVRWRALSADGHVGSGVFTFGLGVPAPPPSEAYGASGPSLSDDLARWALFVSLALLLGALGFRLVALRGIAVPARVERRLYVLAGVGVVATLEAGTAGFIMRAEDALQLPFDRLLYGDLSSLAGGTRFGEAFVVMTLGYAAVAALVFLAWLFDRPPLLWPAFATGLVMAGGLSLSGHSAVEPNSTWLTQIADWLHLCAAAVWAGGLVALAVCVWPAAPALRRRAFLGFSRLATALIACLLAAGVYLSVARLTSVEELWRETYGRVLLVKLCLVSLALAWGAAHHFLVRPRLERGEAGGGRVRRSLLGESAVGMAVLLVAAILVNAEPPDVSAPSADVSAGAGR